MTNVDEYIHSIITLNVNNLSRDCQTELKNDIQLYAVYSLDSTTQIGWKQKNANSNDMKAGMLSKDELDFKTRNVAGTKIFHNDKG